MKEWYLATPKPNICSDYESDVISEYAEDNFTDVLETTFADTVLLYNSALSTKLELKCIVQGNIADTQLKSMERTILLPMNSEAKAGMYVFFEGSFWLLTGYPSDNKSYKKITASLCNFKLRWQNSFGAIIERWAYSSDFTKYSSGRTGNNIVSIGDNQYGLVLPIDSETKKLKRDLRFAIDFDDAIEPDIYLLTNRKAALNNYQSSNNGGTIILTMSFDSFNQSSDKRVTLEDGSVVWICDYNSPTITPQNKPNETTVSTIIGNRSLKVGYPRTYTVSFTDNEGNELNDVDFSWNVSSDFNDKILQVVDGNMIKLQINDFDYISSNFLLEIHVDGALNTQIQIDITSAF